MFHRFLNVVWNDTGNLELLTIVKRLAGHFTTEAPFDLGGVKFETSMPAKS